VSFLVKPGKYRIKSSLVVDDEKMVDIIGDISEDQKPSDVTFYTSGWFSVFMHSRLKSLKCHNAIARMCRGGTTKINCLGTVWLRFLTFPPFFLPSYLSLSSWSSGFDPPPLSVQF
jgi:hypothetical protein